MTILTNATSYALSNSHHSVSAEEADSVWLTAQQLKSKMVFMVSFVEVLGCISFFQIK